MNPTITFVDDNDEEHELPARWRVCGTCDGRGTHVNPSVDGHGIGAEEWERDWSDEEREGYFRGDYDVTCYECKGRTTVMAVDRESCDPELYKKYQEHLREERSYAAMEEMERKMGA